MKKRGFTLAEVLVTLGIIGIIAALIVPAANMLRPDKDKAAYLQVYDTLNQTVKDLASNSRLYPVCKDPNLENNVNCSDYPLFNTNKPLDEKYNNAIYQGDRKLCSLLGLSLGVAEDDLTECSNTAYNFNAEDYTNGFANASFTTQNGMRWRIVPAVASSSHDNSATYQTDVYVDINPSNNGGEDVDDTSCIYNSESCTNPDIFKFMISADGSVIPADAMGKKYIETRKTCVKQT